MLRIKSTKLAGQLKWRSINEGYLKKIISFAKNEDLKGVGLATPPHNYGDQSSKINPSLTQIQSELIAREPLVLCGVNLVPLILKSYSKELKFISKKFDGEMLMKDEPIGIIEGPCKMILKAERVVLNFLQHLSGISTLTQVYTSQLNKETPPHKRIKLLDTRKTTPCYRA